MKICIHTFGCQMNKLDSELVTEALAAAGHSITADETEADAVLFNTCSVRDHAEQRVLSRLAQLRPMKEERPGLIVGVLGCFAQRMGPCLRERAPVVDLVCGTRQFPRIAEWIEAARAGPVIATDETSLIAPGVLDAHGRSLQRGVQAYVSVMRGCNNFCSYCVVPYVRGREESRPLGAVVEEARILQDRGVKEIRLLGQNIDAYGKDIGRTFAELLHAVHEAVPSVPRLRFATSHPRDITPDLVAVVAECSRVCEHIHMPAQSGATPVLQRMKRGYTRDEYDAKLALIRDRASGTLVASDFIVGFPGETEADFQQTVELVRSAHFQNSFIFKYSPRPGTLAARELEDDVPLQEKKRRNRDLLQAQEEVNGNRANAMIGSDQIVLVEGVSPRDPHRLIGRTPTNLICVFEQEDSASAYIGRLVRLKIEKATPLTLFGIYQNKV